MSRCSPFALTALKPGHRAGRSRKEADLPDVMKDAGVDADAALECIIVAHRRAIDRCVVLDWQDQEAIERELLREAVHDQAALRAAMR
jgi:hypothetical protein